jgi:Transposase and inactivated derivatives
MAEYEDIRTGRHCTFVLHAHLVFVTKYRHKVFTDAHLIRLEEIMRDVCGDFEVELAEFNGESNHVHLLVNFPPKVALSKLVNSTQRRVIAADAPRVPRPGAPLLPGEQAVVGVLLRRICRRRPDLGPAPLHRAAQPPGLEHARGLAATPARAFTPGLKLKAGALARIPVAATHDPRTKARIR